VGCIPTNRTAELVNFLPSSRGLKMSYFISKYVFVYVLVCFETHDTRLSGVSCPFLILHSFGPDFITTDLHIFLSLSYSFLLLAGLWLSYSSRRFHSPWESHSVRTHCQKCRIFMNCKPAGNLAYGTEFAGYRDRTL
jgi:hypothetical protein